MDYSFEYIVAVNENGIIGINNKIPWHIPEDLQHFKKLTEGHIVIMGRKTYESLPSQNRPLKNRVNIILTNQPELYEYKKDLLFTTKENLFFLIKENQILFSSKRIFVIGGSEIYHLFIDYCRVIHMTHVYYKIDSNFDFNKEEITFFPYSVKVLLNKGFYIQKDNHAEEEKEEQTMISKNENINFKYSTFIKKDE